eukprot:scaffold85179_cov33-Tisochrysis_lutea.AAC.3
MCCRACVALAACTRPHRVLRQCEVEPGERDAGCLGSSDCRRPSVYQEWQEQLTRRTLNQPITSQTSSWDSPMVAAPSAAVVGLTSRAREPTPVKPAVVAKASACSRDIRPDGRGRLAVRAICASLGISMT